MSITKRATQYIEHNYAALNLQPKLVILNCADNHVQHNILFKTSVVQKVQHKRCSKNVFITKCDLQEVQHKLGSTNYAIQKVQQKRCCTISVANMFSTKWTAQNVMCNMCSTKCLAHTVQNKICSKKITAQNDQPKVSSTKYTAKLCSKKPVV